MNFILVGIVASSILSAITYIASENVIFTILIFLISSAFFLLIVNKSMKRNHLKNHRYHQCFQFINSFIVSLNVTGSMNAAFQRAYETTDDTTKEIVESIKDLNEQEKLSYLIKYFKFDLYRLFVDIIDLWNEEGGDIIKMSQYLVNQARLKEQYLVNCETIHRQKTIEFVVLWAITLAILGILRFALSQFFSHIRGSLFYQISVFVIVLFAIFSVYILLIRVNKVDLEGWKDDEE